MVFVMYVWYGRYFQIPCTCCALDRCSSTRKHPFSAHGDSNDKKEYTIVLYS